jgi:hypothetical protein
MRGILGDLLARDDAQRSSAPFLTTSLRNYLLRNKISNQTLGTPQNGGRGTVHDEPSRGVPGRGLLSVRATSAICGGFWSAVTGSYTLFQGALITT